MDNLINELEKIRGKTLLVCYPHPDDETMISGGLLREAKKYDIKTVVLVLTQGGEGKMHIHPRGKSVKEVRTKELNSAMTKLKVDKVILENYPDAYLRDCKDLWTKKLTRQIRELKPAMVVTYDHSGITGNPDHIVLSLELTRIISSMKKNARPIFYFATLDLENKPLVSRYMCSEVLPYVSKATSFLKINIVRKILTARVYKSQNVMNLKTALYYLIFLRKEWYHKVDFDKTYPFKYVPFKL
ncbi:PIG-L family deacetylase [Candidatus Woesebacteria bacterium]|nr:MAG: PIG-L family deacetylase [Candidatus Woesebacteria bacterium]